LDEKSIPQKTNLNKQKIGSFIGLPRIKKYGTSLNRFVRQGKNIFL
jgi:hypothetical protein